MVNNFNIFFNDQTRQIIYQEITQFLLLFIVNMIYSYILFSSGITAIEFYYKNCYLYSFVLFLLNTMYYYFQGVHTQKKKKPFISVIHFQNVVSNVIKSFENSSLDTNEDKS